MKKCPPGEYYCHDSKKCKKIPSGYHVGARGYLAKDDDENGKKNGNGNGTNGHSNGNGNGNGSNGNGGGMSESTMLPRRTGNIIDVYVGWRGKGYAIKMFFPQIKKTFTQRSTGSSEKSVSWCSTLVLPSFQL